VTAAAVPTRLFEPIDVGGMTLRNRLMMTVHGPRLSAARYQPYLAARSMDVGLVGLHAMYGVYDFPFGPAPHTPAYAGAWDAVPPHPLTDEGRAYYEGAIATMAAQVEIVHANGARAVGQIFHPGLSQHDETFRVVVGPSPVPDEFRRHVGHELSLTELADLVEACRLAARRAVQAGLDGIELHAAHGYLLNQFLSPLTNQRSDRYGGPLENRLRLLLEIIGAVRDGAGAGVPIGVRVPGTEAVDRGLDSAAMQQIARRLAAEGVAYLNVSSGNYTGLRRGAGLAYVAPPYAGPGPSVAAASAIRAAAGGVRVIVAGRITDLAVAEQILVDGHADMIGLTRALIADPRIVEKVRTGRAGDVTPCVGGNECHYGRTVACAVNPAAGREEELASVPATSPRQVLVVGAGPAGMECARVAARRGHRVRLVDEAVELGGTLRVVGSDPNRREFLAYLDSVARQLDALGVDIQLGCRLTADASAVDDADAVVLATGSTPWIPPVPGIERSHVVTSLDVLQGRASVGSSVVVVGGLDDHLPPLTTADFVADGARRVTLLAEPMVAGEAIEAATLFALTRRLLEKAVELEPMTALHAVGDGSVVVRNTLTNATRVIEGVDTVILACGRRPRRELAAALARRGRPFSLIGDCLSPRRLVHATLDGARQGVLL
jgi:2,4-dienoyl-CoA reductase-like NADH-dependent reductase (Old Yellow Enzyme family)/thioredoxin reductase